MKYIYVLLIVPMFSTYTLADASFSPPYLGHSSNWMMAMFKVKADKVQPFLPKWVELSKDEEGMASLGLEIYELDDVSGLPKPYFVSFIFAQTKSVKGKVFPSNFPVWGVFNDPDAASSYAKNLGFPFQHSSQSFSLTRKGNRWIGLYGDSPLIHLEVEQTTKKSKNVGVANMIGVIDDKLTYSPVAWINNGYDTKKARLKINPLGDPILELIQGAKPFWSLVSDNQIFTYTKARFFDDTLKN